jgi:lysophospholipase L1-like esterase
MLKTLILITVVTSFVAFGKEIPPGLKENETICFYGDSITHHNHYVGYLTLFYATRYPNTKVRIYNAGVGGNRIATGLMRFRQDIVEQNPKVVAFAFGMNDGNYRMLEPKGFGEYQKKLGILLERVKKETKANMVLLTPAIFDYAVRAKRKKARGREIRQSPLYNQTLMLFGDFLKKVGRENGFPVIDLNAPMLEVLNILKLDNPEASLHTDGIHPLEPGHFIMFQTILKGFGVSSIVSTVSIDSKTKDSEVLRGNLDNINVEADKIEFDFLQESLPFPIPEKTKKIAQLFSFNELLNQETIQLTNLEEGSYELDIDGEKIGVFSNEQFQLGINMAALETPQLKQAKAVMKINDELQIKVKTFRDFRLWEKKKYYRKPDGTYPKMKTKKITGEDGKVKNIVDEEWEKKFAEKAKTIPPLLEEIKNLREKIYQINKPAKHHYTITKK